MSGHRFGPVKIGILGLGRWGRRHAATLAGLAEAELVALEARRQASLDAVTEQVGDIPGWLDLDAAIAESDAEAWVVAGGTASHVPITRTLLAAGKPVLLEKPIAQSLAAAETLAPLVHDCRVVRGMESAPRGASYAHAMQVQRWLDRLEASADAS